MNYTELHLHDHYSVLDGLNTPKEYFERAAELGMTHLAQTNHGTLSGWRDFQREALAAGIKPILGVEAYISSTDRFDRRTNAKREDGTSVYNHIGLLAQNEVGQKNINRLMAEAWTGGFYNKPRIDMEILEQFNEGVIVLSGCMSGLMSKSLEAGNYDKALKTATHIRSVFGERFFMEIQGHNDPALNAGLLQLCEDTGVLPVVTSDCHYARKEDLWVEEAMLILATNPKVAKGYDLNVAQKMGMLERFNYLYPDRRMTFEKIEIYLRNAMEQKVLLEEQGIGEQPILNTMVVADMIEDYPYYKNLDLLPKPDIKGDSTAELRRRVFEGMARRGLANDPESIERANMELGVIAGKGFDDYFINLHDIVDWALKQGIFIGPGRGSGVSSFVNYCLYITNINPIPKKLLFFRFLDPERDDWPDVDVDFEKARRHEVKEHVLHVYGEGHVANIMTFGYYRGKSAIKAAARVLKVPAGEVNKATAGLSDDADGGVIDKYATAEGLAPFRHKYPDVLALARRLEGRIQNVGMHAGGTVISRSPIAEYVPMQTANDTQDEAKDRVAVIGYDMKDAADIGFIKMDFLGLSTLTVILETLALIKNRTGVTIDPYEIAQDDQKVYEMLSAGHTKGVFQCEGGPYTKLLISMGGVRDFDDLVASNALVRPGAAKSSIGENYIKGKNTGEFEYIHADTKYFTEETFGQILFQEQQMLLCTTVAGMSMRDANKVRQAISKKILVDLEKYKPAFIEGATRKIGARKAEAVWDDLEKSAEYAFNKAHSEGYSLLSYWTAWLKANYPLEFMTVLINNVGGTDKNDKTLDYLMECKRLGLKVKLPHVNSSEIKNTIEGDAIRMGLDSIKYISGKSGAKLIEHRPYASYDELVAVAKQKGSGINTRAIGAMNAIGAASFPDNPKTGNERDNFYEYLNIPAFDSAMLDPHIKQQFTPLDEFTEDEAFVVMGMVRGIKVGTGWSLVDLVDETGVKGVFTGQNTPIEKGKMYVFLIDNNRIARYLTTDELVNGEGGALGKYLEKERLDLGEGEYRCISWRSRTTRNGQKMANAIFTDGDKNLVSCAVFGKLVDKAMMPCMSSQIVNAKFREGRNGGLQLEEI